MGRFQQGTKTVELEGVVFADPTENGAPATKNYVDTRTNNLTAAATGTSLTVTPARGTGASIPAATTSAWGAMTDEDKANVDKVNDLTQTELDILDGATVTTTELNLLDGITALANVNVAVPSDAVFTDTTYSAGNGLSLSNGTFSLDSMHSAETHVFTDTTARNAATDVAWQRGDIAVTTGDGHAYIYTGTNLSTGAATTDADWSTLTFTTTTTTYTGQTAAGNYTVPVRDSGDTTTKFLREDGDWVIPNDTDTIYTLPVAGSALGGVLEGGDIDISDTGVMTIVANSVGTDELAADQEMTRTNIEDAVGDTGTLVTTGTYTYSNSTPNAAAEIQFLDDSNDDIGTGNLSDVRKIVVQAVNAEHKAILERVTSGNSAMRVISGTNYLYVIPTAVAVSGEVFTFTNTSSGTSLLAHNGTRASDATSWAFSVKPNTNEIVTTNGIVPLSIASTHITADAVTTEKINDGAVTTAKIPDDAVTTAKIADSAVATASIANNNVTNAKLADSTITVGKFNDEVFQTFMVGFRGYYLPGGDVGDAGEIRFLNSSSETVQGTDNVNTITQILVNDLAFNNINSSGFFTLTDANQDNIRGRMSLLAAGDRITFWRVGSGAAVRGSNRNGEALHFIISGVDTSNTGYISFDVDTTNTTVEGTTNTSGVFFSNRSEVTFTKNSARILEGANIEYESVGTRAITDSAITNDKIADNTISETKLAIHNSPAAGNLLEWDGTNNRMQWVEADSSSAGLQTSNYDGPQNIEYPQYGLFTKPSSADSVASDGNVAPAGTAPVAAIPATGSVSYTGHTAEASFTLYTNGTRDTAADNQIQSDSSYNIAFVKPDGANGAVSGEFNSLTEYIYILRTASVPLYDACANDGLAGRVISLTDTDTNGAITATGTIEASTTRVIDSTSYAIIQLNSSGLSATSATPSGTLVITGTAGTDTNENYTLLASASNAATITPHDTWNTTAALVWDGNSTETPPSSGDTLTIYHDDDNYAGFVCTADGAAAAAEHVSGAFYVPVEATVWVGSPSTDSANLYLGSNSGLSRRNVTAGVHINNDGIASVRYDGVTDEVIAHLGDTSLRMVGHNLELTTRSVAASYPARTQQYYITGSTLVGSSVGGFSITIPYPGGSSTINVDGTYTTLASFLTALRNDINSDSNFTATLSGTLIDVTCVAAGATATNQITYTATTGGVTLFTGLFAQGADARSDIIFTPATGGVDIFHDHTALVEAIDGGVTGSIVRLSGRISCITKRIGRFNLTETYTKVFVYNSDNTLHSFQYHTGDITGNSAIANRSSLTSFSNSGTLQATRTFNRTSGSLTGFTVS